jgi:hypothetical protein
MAAKKTGKNGKVDPKPKQVPLAWIGLEDTPIRLVNQCISQIQDDAFVVSLGTLMAPPIFGPKEERLRLLEGLTSVPVQTVTRVALTYQGMKQLIGVLQENMDTYEKRLKTKNEQ